MPSTAPGAWLVLTDYTVTVLNVGLSSFYK